MTLACAWPHRRFQFVSMLLAAALALLPSPGAALLPDPLPSDMTREIGIAGSVWSGEADGHIFICRFEKGGILNYTSPTGTFRNGTWKQKDGSIYLEMNNKYAEYVGTIKGERIEGTAANVAGQKWTWHVKRDPKMIASEP